MNEAAITEQPLSRTELQTIDAYWRAANYLSVGQIYLMGNPLLTRPLRPEDVKPRLLGHTRDAADLEALFRQFSFPGGIPSHVAPETPGSIHEGGELGYALAHAYGAVFDNPGLIAACVIGDGEAETGPKTVDGVQVEGTFRAHQVPHRQRARQPRAPGPARGMDAVLPARRAVRPGWEAGPRAGQDPGFIDHVMNKKAEVIRVYLPPDANTLLSVADHCLRSRNYVNVIVAGKQPQPQWLTMEQAVIHCTRGAGIWDFASSDNGDDEEPDVVLACAGDVPTLETLAAASLLREHLPSLPHGMSDAEFDALFTSERPVIFAYHGYPWLIHRLTYRRHGHHNLHVRGYKEEGITTTPFDMVMLNDLDRYHLVIDVIDRVPGLAARAGHLRQLMTDKRIEARAYTREFGEDAEINNWAWPQ